MKTGQHNHKLPNSYRPNSRAVKLVLHSPGAMNEKEGTENEKFNDRIVGFYISASDFNDLCEN